MLRCLRLSKGSAAAYAHSTQPANGLQRAEVLPTLPVAVQLEQSQFPASLPNAAIVRDGEHGSFVGGEEARPSMKEWSLGMQVRSTVPFRHGVRELCSTLPDRRSDLSRFALAAKRMYLLFFNASSFAHRVLTGA